MGAFCQPLAKNACYVEETPAYGDERRDTTGARLRLIADPRARLHAVMTAALTSRAGPATRRSRRHQSPRRTHGCNSAMSTRAWSSPRSRAVRVPAPRPRWTSTEQRPRRRWNGELRSERRRVRHGRRVPDAPFSHAHDGVPQSLGLRARDGDQRQLAPALTRRGGIHSGPHEPERPVQQRLVERHAPDPLQRNHPTAAHQDPGIHLEPPVGDAIPEPPPGEHAHRRPDEQDRGGEPRQDEAGDVGDPPRQQERGGIARHPEPVHHGRQRVQAALDGRSAHVASSVPARSAI